MMRILQTNSQMSGTTSDIKSTRDWQQTAQYVVKKKRKEKEQHILFLHQTFSQTEHYLTILNCTNPAENIPD